MHSSSNDANRTTPPTLPPEDTQKLQKMATAGLEGAASPEPPAQATDAGESTSPTGTPKTPRAKFDKPENLPEEDAELTPEEISRLLYQSRVIRKKYGRYFGTNGRLRRTFYNLIFERLPNGELKHQEAIINSNVPDWRNTLLHFEDPKKYDAKGREKEGARKANATGEEPSKKRKRSPAKEGGPSSVSQDQDQQSNPPDDNVVIGSSADEQLVARPASRATPVSASSSESVLAALGEPLPTTDSDSRPAIEERACSPPSVSNEEASLALVTGPSMSAVPGSPLDKPADLQPAADHEPTAGSAFDDLGLLGQAQIALPSNDNDKHDTAAAAGDHPDVQMTESRQDESNEPTDQTENDHPMEEATPDAAPMRQAPDTNLCRVLSNFEVDDLNLLDGKDLSEFAKWINVKIHTLNLNLMQAREAGRSQKYRECLNTLITRLLMLQKACFNLEEQLKTDRMSEE